MPVITADNIKPHTTYYVEDPRLKEYYRIEYLEPSFGVYFWDIDDEIWRPLTKDGMWTNTQTYPCHTLSDVAACINLSEGLE